MLKSKEISNSTKFRNITIIGTVGVPGQYGGFETLADNLAIFHETEQENSCLSIYCSSKAYPKPRRSSYRTATLRYLPLHANGIQSIAYDILSMVSAILHGSNRLLLLGVSSALGIPALRLCPWVRIVTNIDGIEWKRAKWSWLARKFLKLSESIAVKYSHVIIADNQVIADYVLQTYGRVAEVIAYGGDHALNEPPVLDASMELPDSYALALCRIEPENNVGVILEAWSKLERPLVFVGNWNDSAYGVDLRVRFADHPMIHLKDPIYDPSSLRALRDRATLYIHGHSAGGTNPSLVEMMHFNIPVVAWDCNFNRHTTQNAAVYFKTTNHLVSVVNELEHKECVKIGAEMRTIAQDQYCWDQIASKYFKILDSKSNAGNR